MKYNIYDLLGPRSREYLKKIVAKTKVHISDKELYEKNQSRASLFTMILSDLDLSPKSYELNKQGVSGVLDVEEQKEFAEDNAESLKEFNKKRMYYMISALLDLRLLEEAMDRFALKEKLKDFAIRYHEYLKKIGHEHEKLILANAEIELERMRNAANVSLMKELQRIRDEAKDECRKLKEQRDSLNEEIAALHVEREQIYDKHSNEFAKKLKEYKTPEGKAIFADVDDETLKAFSRDYLKNTHERERKLIELEHENEKSDQKIEKYKGEIKAREAEIKREIVDGNSFGERKSKSKAVTNLRDISSKAENISKDDPKILNLTQKIKDEVDKKAKRAEEITTLKTSIDKSFEDAARAHFDAEKAKEVIENKDGIIDHLEDHLVAAHKELHEVSDKIVDKVDLKGDLEEKIEENISIMKESHLEFIKNGDEDKVKMSFDDMDDFYSEMGMDQVSTNLPANTLP